MQKEKKTSPFFYSIFKIVLQEIIFTAFYLNIIHSVLNQIKILILLQI